LSEKFLEVLNDGEFISCLHTTDKTHIHLSSWNRHVQWPATSLQLSTCDYLPCKYLTNKEYVIHPRTDTKLKQNMRKEIAAILVDMTST
jgi:hypothetical protein